MREVNQDITKLPKWAQARIESAERDAANFKAQLNAVSTQHTDSRVAIDGHHVYPDHFLPKGTGLIFFLGEDRDRWANTLEVAFREKGGKVVLEVRGSDRGIRIIPASYNSIRLELDV